MTQPTTIFFGPDTVPVGQTPLPKIYLRSLLFSTSKRGRVIENMYVTVSRNETVQNFSIWVYGEHKKLVRGSGLFVGEAGVSANHHFLTPKDDISFKFIEGTYHIEVFAHLVGDKKRISLFSQKLEVSKNTAELLLNRTAGAYFDWGPDSGRYLIHVEDKPPVPDFLEALDISSLMGRSA